jgi:phosphohistidine phosphatase
MDLILWRHAEALAAEPGADDLARPLTDKGLRDARRMGQWLQRCLPESTRVLVSPALRTRQTAEALGRNFTLVPELGPQHSVALLLQAAGWPEASGPVLVVGHQSTLGQTVASLMTGQAEPWTVRKGAIWWLRGRKREGSGAVLIHAVLTPELA